MLISHKYKFIYLRPKKVAGTSTEAFLERYCLPDELESTHQPQHTREEEVTSDGILGSRRVKKNNWFAHKLPKDIKTEVGEEIWNSYVKVCNIRNPFDLAVSFYTRKEYLPPNKNEFEIFLSDEKNLKTLLKNKKIWSENGSFSHDYYIRQENLVDDLNKLMDSLKLPNYNAEIPTYKVKHTREHYSQYYNIKTKKIIEDNFKEELEFFNYSFSYPFENK
jgi:hypothetical protein